MTSLRSGKVRRSVAFSIAGFGIPTLVTLASYPTLDHGLGHVYFGVFLLAVSISGFLSSFDLGMSAATVRFIADRTSGGDRAGAGRVLQTSLVFYGIFGVAGGTLIMAISPYLAGVFAADAPQGAAVAAFRLAGLQFALQIMLGAVVAALKGLQKFDLSTSLLVLNYLLGYGLAATLVWLWGIGVVEVMVIAAGASALALVAAILLLRRAASREIALDARPALGELRLMASFGVALLVGSIASILLYKLQQFWIASDIGVAQSAAFALALSIVLRVHGLVASASEIVYPLAAQRTQDEHMGRTYLEFVAFGAGLALLLLVPLYVWSDALFGWWFHNDLGAAAAALVRPLCFGGFLLALSPAPYYMLNGRGRPWVNVAFGATTGSLNLIAMTIASILSEGARPFAWAFVAATALTTPAYLFVAWRTVRSAPVGQAETT